MESHPPQVSRKSPLEGKRAIFLKRVVLVLAYFAVCILALFYLYQGEAWLPVLNILASWGVGLGHVLEIGGYVGIISALLVYLVGLYAVNTILVYYSKRIKWMEPIRWRWPISQLVIHWTGAIFAFDRYGNILLPPVKDFMSIHGLMVLLTIFFLPAIASSSYIVADWRIAIKG